MVEYQLDAPATVNFNCYRAGVEIFLQGNVDFSVKAQCARCAEEFGASKTRDFRYVLAPRSLGLGAGGGEDVELYTYEGDEIDLTPLAEEQILLALSSRPLCREDCRGLCASCGANLNQTQCDCRTPSLDPRLAVLRTLKAGRTR